jgi:hypothetical protein
MPSTASLTALSVVNKMLIAELLDTTEGLVNS